MSANTRQFDLIVIGGGPAGVTAALRARELGASVALVERQRMGGTCTNDGCVPTRVLAKAARLLRDSEQFKEYGLIAERPIIDLPALIARTQQAVYQLHEKKQLLSHLEYAGIAVWSEVGDARFVDPNMIALPNGSTLSAHRFILCVGGHARRLPFPGNELALTHSDVWQLKRVPRSVVIVGAAATGCQLASVFKVFGSRVTLLEVAQRILPGEDEAVSAEMAMASQRSGIVITTGIGGIEQIERRDDSLEVQYIHNGETQMIPAEVVILAVGWVGNVETLNLDDAGVKTERSYVVVDDYLRTSAPHIFAAGDVTGRMMLVQSASYEARIAAENAVLDSDRPYRHFIVPHGGFTDPEYASVGLTEVQALREYDCAITTIPYADMDRAVLDDHTEGFCKMIVSRESYRILGAHVVGEQAVEVTQLIAAGMAAGLKVNQLAELELAYPTYSAIVGLAARRLVRELGIVPLAPQWRTLANPPLAEWEQRDT
jgi:pyruvate/2-oxoglutarate dehydrogenase complex dihydrolipoamide dehydrogenase (E3) component